MFILFYFNKLKKKQKMIINWNIIEKLNKKIKFDIPEKK